MATDFDPRNINEGKDKELDGIIRPQDLQDFTGQDKIVSNLKIFVAAAKMRGSHLTMCCSTGLRDLERPRLHI